jgi:hypothetical protein
MKTLQEGILQIVSAINRGKGRFTLGPTPDGSFGLALGSVNMVRVNGGFLITIKLDEEHLRELRDLCVEALTSYE